MHLNESLWLEIEFFKQEERQQRNTGVQKFVRFVFHEIRVPFNSLMLALDCLDGDDGGSAGGMPPRSAEDQELIQVMKDNASAMKRIINDVLSFQKVQEGQVFLLPERVRLGEDKKAREREGGVEGEEGSGVLGARLNFFDGGIAASPFAPLGITTRLPEASSSHKTP